MPKRRPARSSRKKTEVDALRKSLLSIGVDEGSGERLLGSRALERIVVPIYWKDGLVFHVSSLWLQKLPGFLKSFEKEFPDGQVRWDPDFDENNPQGATSDVAIRVFFNYQEDDQGDHWSPKPTSIEEQSYYGMVKRSSYKGATPVQAQAVLMGE